MCYADVECRKTACSCVFSQKKDCTTTTFSNMFNVITDIEIKL